MSSTSLAFWNYVKSLYSNAARYKYKKNILKPKHGKAKTAGYSENVMGVMGASAKLGN